MKIMMTCDLFSQGGDVNVFESAHVAQERETAAAAAPSERHVGLCCGGASNCSLQKANCKMQTAKRKL